MRFTHDTVLNHMDHSLQPRTFGHIYDYFMAEYAVSGLLSVIARSGG